ncbi:MAG TPA: hypothetical protein PLV42_05400 [bacterium]|nr:hypothetical protein [bacterium]
MWRSCLFSTSFFLFAVVSCSVLQKPTVPPPPSFDVVRNELILCESKDPIAACEAKVREALRRDWTADQTNELRFMLARFLAKQERHQNAVTLLREVPVKAPYYRAARVIGALSAFAAKDWDGALEFMLSIYLSLGKEEKIPASRVVFLSYLYRGDSAKAAQWYSKLNEVKRVAVRDDRDRYFAQHPDAAADFAKALAQYEATPAVDAAPTAPAEPTVSTGVAPAVAEPVESMPDMAPPLPAAAVVLDGTYTPDWGGLCIFLSEDDKWRKVNELVEVFFDWFFKEYSKEGVTPTILRYLADEDATPAMMKAKELRCFAGIGPLFSEVAADEFARLSVTTPLPLFAFTPWFSDMPGFLFNLKYTKEREATDLATWLMSRGKKRFAIAYPDDLRGRKLRDLYWNAVQSAGGEVTDALAFGPGDKALLDDVEGILSMPQSYQGTLYRFRQENAAKYTTPTMMKRALDRIERVTPMQADFDTLFVLGTPEQTALLLPAFIYKNVEFDYYSGWEKNRVKENQYKLQTDFNLPWEINTILVAAPSEVKGDASFEKNVDKLIDGMTLAAPGLDISEKNDAWKRFVEAFALKFQRSPYPIEQTLAETAFLVLAAREKGAQGTMAAFIGQLKSAEWPSLTLNRPLHFNERNQLSDLGEIFIGVKNKGFQPAKELFKEEDKKKEEEKRKESATQ